MSTPSVPESTVAADARGLPSPRRPFYVGRARGQSPGRRRAARTHGKPGRGDGRIGPVFPFTFFFDAWLPVVLLMLLSFMLLLVAFRSIVIPAQAILANLLSVGVSYGPLVLVLQ